VVPMNWTRLIGIRLVDRKRPIHTIDLMGTLWRVAFET
jgi:hypothetical protein